MSTSPTIPEKIGRYPVLRVLGTGAMGCVYLARDTQLDRDVAIKTVRVPQGGPEAASYLQRFRNEARAVGRLRHRSIVAVYDVGSDPVCGPYLVLEYVEGATLKEILRNKGPLAPQQVMALAEQVGEALDAAHREGIIHRDIKPDNLLVGSDGVVRLADFGVARVPDAALTGEGQFLGTPCYGAPETLRGREATPLSEQFAFAAVLYEAISGARAFPGSEALAVAHAVIHDDPPLPSAMAPSGARIPPEVDAVVMRALSKEPAQRYPSLSDLVAALRRAYASATLISGSLADTLPAGTQAARRRPPAGAGTTGPRRMLLWPFAVVLVVGLVAVVQLGLGAQRAMTSGPGEGADTAPQPWAMGLEPVDLEITLDAALGLPDAGEDAGALAAADEAGADPLRQLSAFEREELAKDALDRVRRALRAGDAQTAKAALDEAFRLDPEHPDIASLRRSLPN